MPATAFIWAPPHYQGTGGLDSKGPLHTRAKSCDHLIMRAQTKVSEGHRPNIPSTSCRSVVTDRQVWCEAICDRALNEMLFQ